ncbi:MAG: hypothetical protein ACK55Z_06440, partial [bacterium]
MHGPLASTTCINYLDLLFSECKSVVKTSFFLGGCLPKSRQLRKEHMRLRAERERVFVKIFCHSPYFDGWSCRRAIVRLL